MNEPPAVWYPQSGPQSLAYISQADELFFGGAAGGGKSDLAIGLAMTAHIRSLLLRLNSTQLEGINNRVRALMRPKDRFKTVGTYGGLLQMAEGRSLELNGCESFNDANTKFRGRPHDLKIWDELPTFPKNIYEFINGWNRTDVLGQRCRVVGAGNPPNNPEEEWVLDYWKPWLLDFTAEPGQLVWFAKIENEDKIVENGTPFVYGTKKELIYPRSRTFIPALLEDNPILERTGYRQTLQNLPEPYRSQLLYGDMNVGRSDAEHQLIPTEWIELAMKRWRQRTEWEKQNIFLTSMGVDPSRGGKDRTVLCKRFGSWVQPLIVIPGKEAKDGPAIVPKILMNLDYTEAPIIVDLGGTSGGGVVDSMNLMVKHVIVHPFNGAMASEYRDKSGRIKMRNKRTESYWRLRDALDPYGPDPLMLPDDKELKVELTAQRWYMYPSGAGIEEKEDIKKRLGRSPDRADALAMSMMDDEATGGWGFIPKTKQEPFEKIETFMGGVNPEKYPDKRPDNSWNPWGD